MSKHIVEYESEEVLAVLANHARKSGLPIKLETIRYSGRNVVVDLEDRYQVKTLGNGEGTIENGEAPKGRIIGSNARERGIR